MRIDYGDNQYSYKDNPSCVEILLSITSKNDIKAVVITNIFSPTSRLECISYTIKKNVPQSDFLLTSNSIDESDYHGFKICLNNNTKLINIVASGRKYNEITHDKTEDDKTKSTNNGNYFTENKNK